MRKAFLLLLLPTTAFAQAMSDAPPLESLAGSLVNLLPLLVMIAVPLIAGYAVFSGDMGKVFLIVPMLGGLVVAKFFLSVGADPAQEPPPLISPGVMTFIGDWIGPVLLVAAGAVTLVLMLAYRGSRRDAEKARRQSINDLVDSIERADQVIQYWSEAKQAKRVNHKFARDRLSAAQEAKGTLLDLLAIVHAGQVLDDKQRNEASKRREQIERCARDESNTPVVPAIDRFICAVPAAHELRTFDAATDAPNLSKHDPVPAQRYESSDAGRCDSQETATAPDCPSSSVD